MSIKLMNQVWGMKLNHTDKLVLLALADNASDDGICWPSVSTLCKKTCLSRRGIQSSVARLNELNILERVFRNGISNNYLIRIINGEIADPIPAHAVRPPCACRAHPPAHAVRPPCARRAPRTIIEPSIEPSMNLFDEWWDIFPRQRRGSKENAKKAYEKALKRDSEENIHAGTRCYAASDEVARGFAKGAAAWLNDDRWSNDYGKTFQAANGNYKRKNKSRAELVAELCAEDTSNADNLFRERIHQDEGNTVPINNT